MDECRQHAWRALRALWAPVLGFWVAAVWLTGGVWGGPGARVVGAEDSGVWRALWAYDWTAHRLTRDGAWPLDAPEVGFPRTGPFASIAPLHDALSIPLQWVVTPALAHNIMMVLALVLAASGAAMLARQSGAGRTGMWVAGAIFGFQPFLLSYGLESAVVETTFVGLVAWAAWAGLRLVRKPGLRGALLFGLLGCLAGIASFYQALMLALFLPLIVGPALFASRDRAAWIWVGVGIAAAALFFAPLAAPLLQTYRAEGAHLGDYLGRKAILLDPGVMAQHAHDVATLGAYLLPWVAEHEAMDRLTQSTWLGWLPLLLAGAAALPGRRRWLVVALVGLVLSLGPFVFLAPGVGRPEPVLWWRLLRGAMPGAELVTSYVRFSSWAFLGLAILAAHGAERWCVFLGRRGLRPAMLGPLLFVAILLEQTLVNPAAGPVATAAVQVPAVTQAVAGHPVAGALIDWPAHRGLREVEVSTFFALQATHRRPIPADFAPESYRPSPLEKTSFYGALVAVTRGEVTTQAPEPLELHALGFGLLALHPAHLPPGREVAVRAWLDVHMDPTGTPDLWSVRVAEGVPGDPQTHGQEAEPQGAGEQGKGATIPTPSG